MFYFTLICFLVSSHPPISLGCTYSNFVTKCADSFMKFDLIGLNVATRRLLLRNIGSTDDLTSLQRNMTALGPNLQHIFVSGSPSCYTELEMGLQPFICSAGVTSTICDSQGVCLVTSNTRSTSMAVSASLSQSSTVRLLTTSRTKRATSTMTPERSSTSSMSVSTTVTSSSHPFSWFSSDSSVSVTSKDSSTASAAFPTSTVSGTDVIKSTATLPVSTPLGFSTVTWFPTLTGSWTGTTDVHRTTTDVEPVTDLVLLNAETALIVILCVIVAFTAVLTGVVVHKYFRRTRPPRPLPDLFMAELNSDENDGSGEVELDMATFSRAFYSPPSLTSVVPTTYAASTSRGQASVSTFKPKVDTRVQFRDDVLRFMPKEAKYDYGLLLFLFTYSPIHMVVFIRTLFYPYPYNYWIDLLAGFTLMESKLTMFTETLLCFKHQKLQDRVFGLVDSIILKAGFSAELCAQANAFVPGGISVRYANGDIGSSYYAIFGYLATSKRSGFKLPNDLLRFLGEILPFDGVAKTSLSRGKNVIIRNLIKFDDDVSLVCLDNRYLMSIATLPVAMQGNAIKIVKMLSSGKIMGSMFTFLDDTDKILWLKPPRCGSSLHSLLKFLLSPPKFNKKSLFPVDVGIFYTALKTDENFDVSIVHPDLRGALDANLIHKVCKANTLKFRREKTIMCPGCHQLTDLKSCTIPHFEFTDISSCSTYDDVADMTAV